MRVETAEGAVIELGTTEAAPTIGIVDYSRRVTDDFGVTTVVERGFARRMSVRLAVPFEQVDALQLLLADLRATPATWVADEQYACLAFEGFYKDFSIDLAVPPISYCTLTVEGLATFEAAIGGGDPAPAGSASTLQLLQPALVTDAVLTASSVAETDHAPWAAGTSYPLGARVIMAATHRTYESAAAANLGNDPTGASGKWIDVGPTNRWAMFDQALGTATARAGAIAVTLSADAANAIALLDVASATVRVQAAGYDSTKAPASGTVTFLDMPATTGPVTVTIAGPGQVSVGTLLIGTLVSLGVTEAAPTAGITDFSRKDVDAFGEVNVVQRAWAKRMTVNALIRSDAVDAVAGRIAGVRARPSLWIGSAGVDSLTVYGFFKDFSIEVGESVSKLSLAVEGLSKAPPLPPAPVVEIGGFDPTEPYQAGNIVTLPDGSRWQFIGDKLLVGEVPSTDSLRWKMLNGPLDPTYPDGTPISELMPATPLADRTVDVLETRNFALLGKASRIGTETRKRFDPLFWTTNFPNTMMAAVRATAADAMQLDAVFLEKGHLAGLIWESADTLDHPTTGYDTDRDYRGCVLQFRLQLPTAVQSLTDDNGPVLTLEGRTSAGVAKTWYVRLNNAALAGGTSRDATIRLDFNSLPGGFFGTDNVYAGDVDRLFLSFVPTAYVEGSGTRLPAATGAAIVLSNILVTGARSALTCGTGPGGIHDVRMTSGYDDTYNVTPARVIRNLDLLGYRGEFNQYVGMSHYFQWEWSATEGRYIAQDVASPLNTPCRVWHEDLATRLKASGRELIVSLSYEMLNSFMPTAWRQLDSAGAPALTGWEPPSSLFSPCNLTGMGYLAKVARQFCSIASAAGLTVRFQVGEPWYWIDYRTLKPYLYDAATTAAWTAEKGSAPPVINSMASAMSVAQLAYLDWLGGKLAASILNLIAAVRTDHPTMISYALLYLPQLLNGATPEAHRVNMPAGLAYPALDVLQLEDYDFVVANRLDLSATARASAEKKLGYPRSRQEYFAGFALYKDASDAIWRASTNAMADAYDYGVQPVYIWAYTQVLRDGYVPRLKFAPALSVRDLRDVGKAAPMDGQVLAWSAASRSWVPTTVAAPAPSWGNIGGALSDQADLTSALGGYGKLSAANTYSQRQTFQAGVQIQGGGFVPGAQGQAISNASLGLIMVGQGTSFDIYFCNKNGSGVLCVPSGEVALTPGGDGVVSLGTAALRWSQVYAASATINTSDGRAKRMIAPMPNDWLDAWGDVEWCKFKMADAIREKGDGARWHTGLVAQQVRDAFAARGIDALAIGLLCHDTFAEQRGPVVRSGKVTNRTKVVRAAGDQWGLRYEECFAIEAAWQRRELARLKAGSAEPPRDAELLPAEEEGA